MVDPGTSGTPPTMTRPCSPAACASTASIGAPNLSGTRHGPIAGSPATTLAAPLCVGELAGDVASGVAIGDVTPPVMELLAAGEAELDLSPALLVDVEPERHDRLALRLGAAQELVDLGPAEQQLPDPLRLVVVAVGLRPRRDVDPDQPGLVALDPRVRVAERHLAGPDRLDLRAGQDEAGLERLVDREVVTGPPVEGDRLHFAHRGGSSSGWVAAEICAGRTSAGPIRAGVRLLTHPQGVRLDEHLLGGGAATLTVDHCTSPPFVRENPT